MTALRYRQVDVFAKGPLAGNGLAVFITDTPLSTRYMQALTNELRQFESIFLTPSMQQHSYDARVFTMEGEVPFAGHPSLGAAAVLHERARTRDYACMLHLPAGQISLSSIRQDQHYQVTMNQGRVAFSCEIAFGEQTSWLSCFGLDVKDLDRRLPVCVASTGLPYLVIPVTSAALARARISDRNLEQRLATVGAKFVYLFDVEKREGRTWDNAGAVEDIATGSAAGPVAGLLVRYGLAAQGQNIILKQGRFTGRPSEMVAKVFEALPEGLGDVVVSGHVVPVAHGEFDASVAEALLPT